MRDRHRRLGLGAFVIVALCGLVMTWYQKTREADTLRYINANAVVVGCQANFCRVR
jgi:heme A synthase